MNLDHKIETQESVIKKTQNNAYKHLAQRIAAWVLTCLLPLTALTSAARAEERVATLQIENRASLSQTDVQYLSDLVQQAALRLPTDRFSVMTNDNMEVMLPPGTRLEDCVDSCAVQTARNLQAHWLVTGIVSRFGGELKVVLKLYETATGQPRESVKVGARDLKELEGPLQGAALRLFGQLDPSMLEIAERLEGGFVFKKFQTATLPVMREMKDIQGIRPGEVSGIDFGEVDVEVLERYEAASEADQDGSQVKVMRRLELWHKLETAKGELGELARRRVKELYAFEQNRKENLARLIELERADAQLEEERQKQMNLDWTKLSRLLPLKVVSKKDKLRWLEAFMESYGAVEGLNPYVTHQHVKPVWADLPPMKRNRLEAEGRRQLEQRAQRARDLEQRICELEPEMRRCLTLNAERARRQEAERAQATRAAKQRLDAAEQARLKQQRAKELAESDRELRGLRVSEVMLWVGALGTFTVGLLNSQSSFLPPWGGYAAYTAAALLGTTALKMRFKIQSINRKRGLSAAPLSAPTEFAVSLSWEW